MAKIKRANISSSKKIFAKISRSTVVHSLCCGIFTLPVALQFLSKGSDVDDLTLSKTEEQVR